MFNRMSYKRCYDVILFTVYIRYISFGFRFFFYKEIFPMQSHFRKHIKFTLRGTPYADIVTQ